jgi:hypothetical protein
LIGVAIIGSMLFSFHTHRGKNLYIRRSLPDAVSEAAEWLGDRLRPGQTFISTRLAGDAHTLGLRTRSTLYNVAYQGDSAEELLAIWNAVRPSYVVILLGEDPGNQLLQQFGSQIDLSEPPTKFGDPSAKFGQILIYGVKKDNPSRPIRATGDQ